jgi:pimeloyl-ACP methyl ester carboxylesterase
MKMPVRAGLALALGYGALAVAAYLPRRRDATPAAALLGPDDRRVYVDGHALRVRALGAGPPVVLVHGFAGSAAAWDGVAEGLAARHAVYAVDLLGFGLSAKPSRADYSLAGHGRRVAALLAALDLRDVTLAGHSMGGVVAAHAALADAEGRVARLAMLDANFYRRNGPPVPLLFPLPRLLARRFYTPAARAASLRRCFADPARLTPELLERYLAPTRTEGALEALTAFLATPGPATYAALPPRLRLPSLVIWGEADALWPLADARRLHAEVSGSALHIVPGAGHMVQEERPDAVAALLAAFAAGRPGPRVEVT